MRSNCSPPRYRGNCSAGAISVCMQRLVESKTFIRESQGLRQPPSLGLICSGLEQLPVDLGFARNGALRLETIRADDAPRPMLDELERDTVRIAASELENPQSVQVVRPEACVGEIVGEVSFNAFNETLRRMALDFAGTNRRARQAVP